MSTPKTVDYDYGFSTGKRFGSLFKVLPNLQIGDEMLRDGERHLLALKECYPQRLERLKGLASSLGTRPGTLQAYALHLYGIIRGGCTATFSSPPATRDGGVYLTWNIDLFEAAKILRYLPLYVSEIPQCNRYVCFGIPCLSCLGILNEFGLASVVASVGLKDGGGEGLLDFEINNLCMEHCSDVSEAVETYRNTKLYSLSALGAGMLLNCNCMWGDMNGRGVAIEHSSNHIHYQYAEDGIMAITNHHQFLDRNLTGSPIPDELPAIAGSYCRLGRAWSLLKQNRGNMDLQVLKGMMSDHNLEMEHVENYNHEDPIDDGTICVHYWNIPRYMREGKFKKAVEAYLMGKTIASLIIEPKELTIWRCRGNPCKTPYRPIHFKDVFQSGSTNDLTLAVRLHTSLTKGFWRLPGIRRFMDILFRPLFRRFSILLFTILERLVPVETKRHTSDKVSHEEQRDSR